MMNRSFVLSLGVIVLTLLPAVTGAQIRIARTPLGNPVGVATPPPVPGGMDVPGRLDPLIGRRIPFGRFDPAWRYPVVLSSYTDYQPAAAAVPVPYYYPVPVPAPAYTRRRAEKPAPAPYDPKVARIVSIGAGGDGGGGVMRIDRTNADSVRITWRGTIRPIRSARVFLADSGQHEVRAHQVGADRRPTTFSLAGLPVAPAYAGVTVVFADGSTHITLVPLDRR